MTVDVETPFRRRYVAKLVTNVTGLAVNLVNLSVLPRALGPSGYGNFEFLTAFFQAAAGAYDPGMSTAFFTKLSRRNQDAGLLRFFSRYVLGVSVVIGAGLVAVACLDAESIVWPGQEWAMILLAAAFSYATWGSEVVRRVVDAFGLTVSSEAVVLGLRLAGALVVVALFLAGWLTLPVILTKELALSVLTAIGLLVLAAKHWRAVLRPRAIRTPSPILRHEFWVFCSPLLVYSGAGVLAALADRWILQMFAGQLEQGFYGLATRTAAVSFVFSVAMTQLLQREFSRAHGDGDRARIRQLFQRYVPLLYAVTAYFAVFVSAQTRPLVAIVAGGAFAAAAPATALMALAPIHQTYGQLSGSVFYATDQTRLYRNIGIGSMCVGLVATWVVLAPRSFGGFGLGSEGLAFKTLAMQFLTVNVQLWFNLQYLSLSFRKSLAHQITVIAVFYLLAQVSSWLIGWVVLPPWATLISVGAVYSGLVAAACLRWPALAGLFPGDVGRLTTWGRRLLPDGRR